MREKAEQGNAEAQNKLGDCYCYGQGVKKNYQEAIKWYQKSAEYGNANAQLRLGCFYYYGIGVEKDYKKAVEWYKKLVEQGNIEVIKKVADYYYNKQEYQEAVIWLKKLVEQDDAEALEKLGNCYYNGYGVKKDIIKGMGLRLKARKNKKKVVKPVHGAYTYSENDFYALWRNLWQTAIFIRILPQERAATSTSEL